MINIPVLTRLDVKSYGLYPGTQGQEGLHMDFLPGLTLLLGANGLGKTTLVTMIYRVLTGPYDIPGLANSFSLGNISLRATELNPGQRATFSQRVADRARNATVTLALSLGAHPVEIERSLFDLRLTGFRVDGAEQVHSEDTFQTRISELAGVWSFGDWILLLRHIVFYFEDRRALVWDSSAQRQLLRILFLPLEIARRWTQDERAILEADSRARNLRNALNREERALAASESKAKTVEDVRAEMSSLEGHQRADIERRDQLNDRLTDLESRRQASRLRCLKAEQEREARYREVERAKLLAIEARFPERTQSARYILAQLVTEAECLFCGNHVPAIASALESRVTSHRCVVCGSDLSAQAEHVSIPRIADGRVETSAASLKAIEPELAEARRELQEAEVEHASYIRESAQLDTDIANRSAKIEDLIRRLPPEEAELHRQRVDLATLRGRLETLQAELVMTRQAFRRFVQDQSRYLAAKSDEIRASFNRYAEGFLLEECKLVWSPRRESLGQGGELLEFPAFEVDLAGTDFASPVRRGGPEQVSESQREFIDLAFRMALIEVAATSGVGTLIIDAPESSLDAVFAKRAAEVLSRFSQTQGGNRLFVTSNLVEGTLIPTLLGLTTTKDDRQARLVNLFDVAEPTAATRRLRGEYQTALKTMLSSVISVSTDAQDSDQ